ncbi:cuticle protein 7-like, partial [Amphibalanus amphitrite]|uniref:cuticle protein 7-like n=1 Tax=Amphibalanus amphitrite TaxID=1232801 RepID=UPI001C921076
PRPVFISQFVALFAVVAAAAAGSPGYGPTPAVRAAAAAASPLPLVRILESESHSDDQGGYGFRFLSEDDIERQEQSADGTVTGSYSYRAPDGRLISVRYVANALGFRAESDALPTPVPTEYPTPQVPSTEAAPSVRTVQQYSAPAERPAVRQPAVEYEPVYGYRAVSQ